MRDVSCDIISENIRSLVVRGYQCNDTGAHLVRTGCPASQIPEVFRRHFLTVWILVS